MDILQELPLDQWTTLQKKLKRLWPLNIPAYYTIHVNLKHPKIREAFNFKIYCPHGEVENGFVGIINIKNKQEVILFSITEETSKLEEAFIKTNLIDWSKMVYIEVATSLILKSIARINVVMCFSQLEVSRSKMYVFKNTSKPFTNLRLPNGTYAGPVKPDDISRVNDTWPYKHADSHFYFATLASNGLSYGLYSCKHQLLAWVFINKYSFLTHLFCEEEYRGKGYASYVMKWVANDQLKDGNDVFAYVADGNNKPLALFKSIGFEEADDSAFIDVKK